MQELINILKSDNCSCVIQDKDGAIHKFYGKGVSDLYRIIDSKNGILSDAKIADKIVGKGAASLIILGGINRLWTDIISIPALNLLLDNNVKVEYNEKVPFIINRKGDGQCPLEKLCGDTTDLNKLHEIIIQFIAKLNLK